MNLIGEVEKGNVKQAEKILLRGKADPSARDNRALKLASWKGYTNLVAMLLADERVDPAANKSVALTVAANTGHLDIVKMLLKDGRADPAVSDALRQAALAGHTEIVYLLLKDGRADPSNIHMIVMNPHADIVALLLRDKRVNLNPLVVNSVVANGYTDAVVVLLEDKRIEPFLRDMLETAVSEDKPDIVVLLLADGRVDPAIENNKEIKYAAEQGYIDIVAILFQDPRVRDMGLPIPDSESTDPLARTLAEILKWNISRRRGLSRTLESQHKALAEQHLLSHILSYHPRYARKTR